MKNLLALAVLAFIGWQYQATFRPMAMAANIEIKAAEARVAAADRAAVEKPIVELKGKAKVVAKAKRVKPAPAKPIKRKNKKRVAKAKAHICGCQHVLFVR